MDEYRPSVRLVACNCEDAPAPRIPQSVFVARPCPIELSGSSIPVRCWLCYVAAQRSGSAAFRRSSCPRKRRSHGATRMSESVRFPISSPIKTAGLHPLARALFLSFCVHAILLGVVWQIWSTRQQPLQHMLNVELAPAASAMTAPAAVTPAPPAPGETRNDAANNKPRSNRVVRASASTVSAPSAERADVEEKLHPLLARWERIAAE